MSHENVEKMDIANKVRSFLSNNAMLGILLGTMILFEVLIQNDSGGRVSLFSPANLNNLIGQNGYVVILAVGMLMCILTGGNIDLSVGGTVILVGAVAGMFIVEWNMNIYLAIVMCLIFATMIGAWQAFWIAYIGIPPFIVTLAGMLTFRGAALIIMGSQNIGPFPESYRALFNNFIPSSWMAETNTDIVYMTALIIGIVICFAIVAIEAISRINKKRRGYKVEHIAVAILRPLIVSAAVLFVITRLGQHNGIPVILILLGFIVVCYTYFTQNTIHGRYLYAMGGNAKAAQLSGINTKKMMFFAYTNMGFLAGVAALTVTARFNQASTQAGTGYELDAIAACFIGGASAYGGIGKVGGVVIGAIFMGVLNMGMSLLGYDANTQRFIKGLVLLAAVVFDVLSKRRTRLA